MPRSDDKVLSGLFDQPFRGIVTAISVGSVIMKNISQMNFFLKT